MVVNKKTFEAITFPGYIKRFLPEFLGPNQVINVVLLSSSDVTVTGCNCPCRYAGAGGKTSKTFQTHYHPEKFDPVMSGYLPNTKLQQRMHDFLLVFAELTSPPGY